jgi:NTE family protein
MNASRNKPLTVVVVAGAGARGAFEAAALAELLPEICPNGLGNTIFLGTSAGAINVALWASRLSLGKPLKTVGEDVKQVWLGMNRHAVYELPVDGYAKTGGAAVVDAVHAVADNANEATTHALSTATGWIPFLPPAPVSGALQFGSQLFRSATDAMFGVADPIVGHPLERTGALLDTSPLWRNANHLVDFKALSANISEGRLGGVGLVATSCPMDASGGRSRVFLQLNSRFAIPGKEEGSSIDYVNTDELNLSHILSSAAIPIVFPPVKIETPAAYAGWYTDGGVRLNAPIEPAIKLNAERIVVISSHATTYPTSSGAEQRPQIIDIGAQAVHSVLADAMIEDLRAVKRINKMVEDAGAGILKTELGREYRRIELVEVSPANGALSSRAQTVAQEITAANDRALLRFFARFGGGSGRNELLSYLLFEPEYFKKQFDLGVECARKVLAQLRQAA